MSTRKTQATDEVDVDRVSCDAVRPLDEAARKLVTAKLDAVRQLHEARAEIARIDRELVARCVVVTCW